MADPAGISVPGISGSLRRGSFNAAALRAAPQLAPAGTMDDGDDGLVRALWLLELDGLPRDRDDLAHRLADRAFSAGDARKAEAIRVVLGRMRERDAEGAARGRRGAERHPG